jgi:ABC-type microcin C transport system duplicated ATPase subunit YejF
MVLEDAMTALNPFFRVRDQVGQPLRLYLRLKGTGLRDQIVNLFQLLRIPAA